MDAYDKFWQQLEENNFDRKALAALIEQSKCPYLNKAKEEKQKLESKKNDKNN